MFLVLAAAPKAQAGLVINLTFDSSFTTNFNLSAGELAAAENAATYAAQQITNVFNSPLNPTLNITVAGVDSHNSGIFGQSNANFGPSFFQSYTTIRNALIANAAASGNANQIQFNSTLPVNDPTGARAGSGFVTYSAEGKALGLFSSNASDGTITFGNGADGSFTWNFDTANRAKAGLYDFVGVVMHEISEVMGRAGITGDNLGDGGPDFSPIDLARFNNGARSASNQGDNNYFSIDNGVTALKYYNNHNANGLDTVDWASSGDTSHSDGTPDSFNQFSSSGVVNDLTAVDIKELNILGYNIGSAGPAVPEPASVTLLSAGALLVSAYGWRRRKQNARTSVA
jgi:hypothetical protein